MGLDVAFSDFAPEDVADLAPGGGGDYDYGRPLGVEEPEGEIGGDVGFAYAMAGADGYPAGGEQGLGDFFLIAVPNGTEDLAGEETGVRAIFGDAT